MLFIMMKGLVELKIDSLNQSKVDTYFLLHQIGAKEWSPQSTQG